MNLTRRSLLATVGMGVTAGLAACQRPQKPEPEPEPEPQEEPQPEPEPEPEVDLDEFADLAIDPNAWLYDEANDCYYQLGIPYCLMPGSEQYESLSIFVPGAYFEGTKKGRTYACTIAPDAKVGSFTAQTAPVVMPINSSSCSAQECPTSYSYAGLDRYLKAGLVYVYAGFRGRSGGYESTTQEYFSGGAPWPVVDLKAAVRCLRYNASVLPCNTDCIFVFGHGAGGGMGALLAVSGNSESYAPYLAQIGAATHDDQGEDLADQVYGCATWCPLTSYGAVDAAYEWMVGQYSSEGTRADDQWTKLLSSDLAYAYGDYVNGLGLVDGDGASLTLDRIEDGSFAAGSYYNYLTDLIAESAGHFLSHTQFPYTVLPRSDADPVFPGDPSLRLAPASTADTGEGETSEGVPGVRQVQATVYESIESYVSSLNGENRWLTYSAASETADVTGLWGFAQALRPAALEVCAYDAIDRSALANQLFGTDDQPTLHFDPLAASLIESNHETYAKAQGWDETVVSEWRGDLVELDTCEVSVADRVTMTDPLTFLLVDGEPSGVAPHWRINTGLLHEHAPLATVANLACALKGCSAVEDLAFEAVWDDDKVLVERQGGAEDNFVAWVVSSCPEPEQTEEPKESEEPSDEGENG